MLPPPQDALSEQEELALRQMLRTTESAPLDFARGVFAAAATASHSLDPTDWLPMVLNADGIGQGQLRRMFDLLMRDLSSIARCLQLGQPWVPAPTEHDKITWFCKGYVKAAKATALWKPQSDSFTLLLPTAVLAGYLPLEKALPLLVDHEQLEQGPIAVTTEHDELNRLRQQLAGTLAQIFEQFEPLRQRSAQTSTKVGRNEPCPCGSGEKFKRCCGSNSEGVAH